MRTPFTGVLLRYKMKIITYLIAYTETKWYTYNRKIWEGNIKQKVYDGDYYKTGRTLKRKGS